MTAAKKLGSHSHHYWESGYIKAFVYGLALSFLVFIPFIIYDHGYFLFYGDFNVQQVPFYQMCHDAIRSGNFSWSYTTDLGANFIGSYSFYLLGSPFFWLTIPFPSWFVPYMMGPLFMLKFGCAALTSFVFLKRYCSSPRVAVIGSLLYAFSGFSIYNIFFNHFHEAIIIFPLMLAALDSFVLDKRRGLFALACFASCTMNYYFFVGQAVFAVIYWIIRMITGSYKMSFTEFLWLIAEAVIGVGMSCVLLVPSIYAVIQNPRVTNSWSGWNMLLYSNNQRYVHILQCMFFPPDLPARPNFTPDSNAKWSSLGAWLPLFSMTGVFALYTRGKKHWLKILLPLLFLFTFVPVLNSMFQMFNSAYYARWFYMITLMTTLATVISLEDEDVKWGRPIIMTAVCTLAIALPIGLIPKTKDGVTQIGLEQYPDRFWMYVAISCICIVALAVIMIMFRKNRKLLYRVLTIAVAVVAVGYSMLFIGLGKTHSHSTQGEIIPYELNQGKDLNLPGDLQSVRSDFYSSMDNVAMFWQIPSINAFHSIVPGSVMEFYPTIGEKRDVGSRPTTDSYEIRSLLSVKWLFDYAGDSDSFEDNDGKTKMVGWKYYDTQNGFKIYENENFIPMGFSYDKYYTIKEYNAAGEDQRRLMMLNGIVLGSKSSEELGGILKSAGDKLPTASDFEKMCKDRASMACSEFNYTKSGFTARFSGDKERVVFFSVPYEDGWSAAVNGQSAKIYKANVGFMAVKVPAGESEIVFTYRTPGLTTGIIISCVSFALVAVYIAAFIIIKKKKSNVNKV